MDDLFSVAGNTAVVTGGSRGIGLMIARGLAEAVREAEAAVQVLVNNAGATWGTALEEYPAAAWDRCWT